MTRPLPHGVSPLVVFMLVAALGAETAHAQFGVTAGLNFDRLGDMTLNGVDATFDNSSGWHIEVWANFGAGPVAVRPGVRYVQAGMLFDGLSDIEAAVVDDFDVNFVEIPIDLRLRLNTPAVTPYILAGPLLRFPAGVDDELNNDLRPSVSAELGVGLEIPLRLARLYPEIAFTFGLSRFVDDEIIIGNTTFSVDDAKHLNSVMLRLGIGL